MLNQLHLEGYRGFDNYRLVNLMPVNLIVGRNNSGKTSLLEAVQLILSGGDPNVLSRIAWQRGEVVLHSTDQEWSRRDASSDISHFFHGHEFGIGSQFSLKSANGQGSLSVRVDFPSEQGNQKYLFDRPGDLDASYAIVLEGHSYLSDKSLPEILVSQQGAISEESLSRYRRIMSVNHQLPRVVQLITPDSLEPRSMSDMWDRVLLEGKEDNVLAAMKILEPDLSDIFFLSGANSSRYSGRSGVLLGFEGSKRRIPMGSYGEGMRRLLALSLSLAQTAGGVLLIDEIDTGLHWSVMADMWRMVISAAVATNTQVFATTHSLDCLNSLAWICENNVETGRHAAVHKIDSRLEESVTFDATQIPIAISQEIEMR